MKLIILRHLSGSKTNQVDQFPISTFTEAIMGRDQGSTVKFDPDRDDVVGRQHARLICDPQNRGQFQIIDMNSRNGTFVNRQRIFGAVVLRPGDVVQLGPSGPEFEFDLEPRPNEPMRDTRVVDAQGKVPPTRVVFESSAGSVPHPSSSPGPFSPGSPLPSGVGKQTVERMIAQTKSETRRNLFVALGIVGSIALGFGAYEYSRPAPKPQVIMAQRDEMTPTEIAKAHGDGVVVVYDDWKLLDLDTGHQLYQITNNGIPLYKQVGDQEEPLLTDCDGGKTNLEIGRSGWQGSGFVVTSDGFILTNKHVAAGWDSEYQKGLTPGMLVNVVNADGSAATLKSPPQHWVPSKARFVVLGCAKPDLKKLAGTREQRRNIGGRTDLLEVTLPKTRQRIRANIANISDIADVALIQVHTPTPLHALDWGKDTANPGDPVVVMGFPAVSGTTYERPVSQDAFNRESDFKPIPDYTVHALLDCECPAYSGSYV